MGDTFCLTVTGTSGNYISTFQAADGEEYTVQYGGNIFFEDEYGLEIRNVCKNMKINWKKCSSKFIKLSYYNYRQNGSNKLYEETAFVNGKTGVSFEFAHGVFSDGVFVFDIAPHVTLVDEVNVYTKPGTPNTKPTEKEPVIQKNIDQLLFDMQNLFETGDLSDVVLTDGSEDIHAHKIILSTRCSFFARMFEHPMRENLENRVTISDISIEVLKEMLRFLYTGTVVFKDSKMARDLYVAADKYNVKDLREMCSGMLKSVNISNVVDTLILADLCHDKILKEVALLFIFKNYSQLKALDSWNDFMKEHQTLAMEVLCFVIDKK